MARQTSLKLVHLDELIPIDTGTIAVKLLILILVAAFDFHAVWLIVKITEILQCDLLGLLLRIDLSEEFELGCLYQCFFVKLYNLEELIDLLAVAIPEKVNVDVIWMH